MDGYMIDNLMDGEMAMQDVIRATLDDFAHTVDKLSRKPGNGYLIRHLYELMQLMHQDDCFCFMETDPDTYIEGMLELHGLKVADLVAAVCRKSHA